MDEENLKDNSPQNRWKILRTFIKNGNRNVQYKHRHVFGLFRSCKITDWRLLSFYNGCQNHVDYEWLLYTCEQFPTCRLAVRQRVRAVNWIDATGFDNTGNICVWPSEEILSYLCIKNSNDFKGKTVCELGAGMTGLAGMMLGITSGVREVLITDGNRDSVTNLQEMKYANKSRFGESEVKIRIFIRLDDVEYFGETHYACYIWQLRWDMKEDGNDIQNYFDYVLCADCLLYDQVHDKLLNTMCALLKADGEVLIVSPRRGSSADHFIEKAQELFELECVENYDVFVWSSFCKEKELSPSSEAVRNFPVLIKMRKKSLAGKFNELPSEARSLPGPDMTHG